MQKQKRQKKISNKIFICIALSFLLINTGCQNTSKTSVNKEVAMKDEEGMEILRLYIEEEPMDLNPITADDEYSFQVIANTYDTLFSYDKDNANRGLCEKYEISKDGLFYDIYLRNSKWSDGSIIEASDVYKSFLELLDPKNASKYSDLLFDIKNAKKYYLNKLSEKEELGIEVIDSGHIRIELEKPNEDFLKILSDSHLSIVSKDQSISSGPYYIYEKINNRSVKLRKNEYYWDSKQIFFDEIEYTINSSSNKTLNDFLRKKVEIVKVDETLYNRIDDNEKQMIYNGYIYYLILNPNKEYIKDKYLRSTLIDRIDEIAISELMFPEKRIVNNDIYLSFGGEKANGKIENSGKVLPQQIQGIAENDNKAIRISAGIQQMLKANSEIQIKIDNSSENIYYNNIMSDKYDFYIYKYRSIIGSNLDYVKNIFDLVYKKDYKDMFSSYQEANNYLKNDRLIKPICLDVEYYGISRELDGIIFTPYGTPLVKYAYKIQ